jgi:hypothetical protein
MEYSLLSYNLHRKRIFDFNIKSPLLFSKKGAFYTKSKAFSP